MPDPRDFLPPPPWEGPPIPEAFLREFQLTPERIRLIQQINDEIRKRQTYGLRTETIEGKPAWKLVWSNSSADWYRARLISNEYGTAFEEFTKTPEYRRLAPWKHPTPPRYPNVTYKLGETDTLDANEVLVYGKATDIDAVLKWLEPLPLYVYSFEAKTRGIYDPLGHLRALVERWRRGELGKE